MQYLSQKECTLVHTQAHTQELTENRVLVVIPLYNHGATVLEVIRGVMLLPGNPFYVLVVDDGSNDNGKEQVLLAQQEFEQKFAINPSMGLNSKIISGSNINPKSDLGLVPNFYVNLVQHKKNKGKGQAIRTATAWAAKHNFSHIITIDADGQHDPGDIPLFFEAIQCDPTAFWVGERNFSVPNVPGASKFGRSFSAFWMRLQTGKSSPDVQSGFRCYPVNNLLCLSLSEARYAFEVEVLVKATWAGFVVKSLPVSVYYPPPSERVSHFKKVYDNFLISILNTKLTIRALIPLPFNKYNYEQEKLSVLHPVNSLRILLVNSNTPFVFALSTFVAVLSNMLPIIGLQAIFLLFCISWLKLNRVWALTVSHACWPPVVIAISIEAGHFIRHGEFLTDLSWNTIAQQAPQRIWEWIIGGVVFGPVFALFWGTLVFVMALWVGRQLKGKKRA